MRKLQKMPDGGYRLPADPARYRPQAEGERRVSTNGLVSCSEVVDVLDSLPFLVREKRRRDGLSLRGAAKVSGVSFSTICRVEEDGYSPTIDVARTLLLWVAR